MLLNEELCQKISRRIPHHSVGRYDLLPIFSDVTLFNEIIDHLCKPYEGKVDCVLALEATGWILGSKVRCFFCSGPQGRKITLSG